MNIKKSMAVLLVGGALSAAVFGSAASITNTVPKLGGSSAAVAACDSTVTTSYATAYDAALGAYEVTDVTVGALDGTNCNGATLKVTLSNTSNVALGSEKTGTVAGTDTSKVVSYASDNVTASDVANVNVVLVGP